MAAETVNSRNDLSTAHKLIPKFHCLSASGSADFYVRDLHFTLGGLHIHPPGHSLKSMCSVFAGRKAQANIYLFEQPRDGFRASEVMIGLGKKELDQYFGVLKSEGRVEIVDGVSDKEWGFRQFEVADCDGNRIQFFCFLEE